MCCSGTETLESVESDPPSLSLWNFGNIPNHLCWCWFSYPDEIYPRTLELWSATLTKWVWLTWQWGDQRMIWSTLSSCKKFHSWVHRWVSTTWASFCYFNIAVLIAALLCNCVDELGGVRSSQCSPPIRQILYHIVLTEIVFTEIVFTEIRVQNWVQSWV